MYSGNRFMPFFKFPLEKYLVIFFALTMAVSVSAKKVQPVNDQFTNQLIHEKSPYLLQHAHNPVDWYPWGKAAFEKAKRENKPIFLSIGYSTCHWCHVMERESFENVAIAKIMNANFVCIKVDREERPDVDRVYMTFVQATTGGGGWPMSVFLTPDLQPFFGGTYYPPDNFTKLLKRVAELWKADHAKIVEQSKQTTEALRKYAARPQEKVGSLTAATLAAGVDQIAHQFDSDEGGFGGAPKFPQPVILNFLLREYARTGAAHTLDMALFTLRKMAAGGIHDQIGGGFHRYSTDGKWHVPHFEKMLYDQAQLASAYLDAYQITRDPLYADTARDTLDYVLRVMTGKDGGFYCAEDADSRDANGHLVEGAFYVWTKPEIEKALDAEKSTNDEKDAAIFCAVYGVKADGNVAANGDPHGEFAKKNILFQNETVEAAAKKFDKTPEKIRAILKTCRGKLLAVREKRPRPFLDNKIVTSWNGLMISAFARGWQVLGDSRYLAAAEHAAEFANSHLYNAKTGTLLRSYRDGPIDIHGFADDYAFLIQGLVDLYESDFQIRWLQMATALQKKQDALFEDKKAGGYFSTTADDAHLLMRMKNDNDGAEPSASSVSALNLLRLAEMIGDKSLRKEALTTISAFGETLQNTPIAMPQMLCALDFSLSEPKQIVISGKLAAPDTEALLREVWSHFLPDKIVLLADGGDGQKWLAERLDFIKTAHPLDGKAAAYVCENFVCQAPTTDPKKLNELLKKPSSKKSQK